MATRKAKAAPKKKTRRKNKEEMHPLGDLRTVPGMFQIAHCAKCGTEYELFRAAKCACVNTSGHTRARKTIVDGITFDSGSEAKNYSRLKFLESKGVITHLRLQPVFPAVINEVECFKYISDFLYRLNGVLIADDTKGRKFDDYKLKIKVIRALYPEIEFVESKG